MKKSSSWNILWNPFTKIAGWQAFTIGLLVVIASAIIGKYGNVLFDGAIDMHFSEEESSIYTALMVSLIDVLSVGITMIVGALVLTRNFRIIDILGTMTLARTPYLILSICSLFIEAPNANVLLNNPMSILSYIPFLIFTFFSIFITIWVIALMYNAFKISTGEKGGKLIAVFVVALFIAEIISKTSLFLVN